MALGGLSSETLCCFCQPYVSSKQKRRDRHPQILQNSLGDLGKGTNRPRAIQLVPLLVTLDIVFGLRTKAARPKPPLHQLTSLSHTSSDELKHPSGPAPCLLQDSTIKKDQIWPLLRMGSNAAFRPTIPTDLKWGSKIQGPGKFLLVPSHSGSSPRSFLSSLLSSYPRSHPVF